MLLWAAIAVVVGCGALIQSRVLLNHDVGYVVHSATWLLRGMSFGREIVEPNPPLIYYLSIPAAWLAEVTSLNEAVSMRIVVLVYCAIGLALSRLTLAPLHRRNRSIEAAVILLTASAVFALLPGRTFAQREHVSLILGLPYLLMAGCRIEFGAHYPRWLSVIVGVLAGVAFGLKPYFLAVPALVELAAVLRYRSLVATLRTETLAMAGFLLVYAASIPLLAPGYLHESIPLARAIYWAFETSTPTALFASLYAAREPVLLAGLFCVLARSCRGRCMVIALALAGYTTSYFIQAKGYDYHRLPALAMACLLFTTAGADFLHTILTPRTAAHRVARNFMVVLVAALGALSAGPMVDTVSSWYEQNNIRSGIIGRSRMELIRRVRQLAPSPRDRIYAFSTHPFPGFPTVNYLDADWASRMHSQWVLPAVVKRASISDPDLRKSVDWAERRQRSIVLEDFQRYRPRVVLIDAAIRRHAIGVTRFDMIDYFSMDERFASLWKSYRELPRLGAIRIFVAAEGDGNK